MPEEMVGTVSDFFAHPVVAGIELTGTLKVGDRVHIKGHTTDLEFTIGSMQIDNADVSQGKAGDSVGVKVSDRVRSGDHIYRVTD
ncbi:MAG: translation elongation factor-like protein [Chloroflexi bacterium]|jgi:selenocysteine-specific translation elongation factor|nr:translation elongation factor-like protein [Chloroflexota bacterium]